VECRGISIGKSFPWLLCPLSSLRHNMRKISVLLWYFINLIYSPYPLEQLTSLICRCILSFLNLKRKSLVNYHFYHQHLYIKIHSKASLLFSQRLLYTSHFWMRGGSSKRIFPDLSKGGAKKISHTHFGCCCRSCCCHLSSVTNTFSPFKEGLEKKYNSRGTSAPPSGLSIKGRRVGKKILIALLVAS